jgi:hypothetical protein
MVSTIFPAFRAFERHELKWRALALWIAQSRA